MPIENPGFQISESSIANHGLVTPGEDSKARRSASQEREALPLSLLNDFLYCPRRAALKAIEGWREANEHTVLGELVHEHTDLPGYESAISNPKSQILLWRSLPVWSERLGLSGKCDIVEAELRPFSPALKSEISNLKSGAAAAETRKPEISNLKFVDPPTPISNLKSPTVSTETSDLKSGRIVALRPVEYKKGKRRRFQNDDAQLCAQALCLEEMFGIPVPCGAVFHAASKRRREVEFTPQLRALTEHAVQQLHALLAQSEISNLKSEIPKLPPALWHPACKECSLYEICLPKATARDNRAARLAQRLFAI